jgi:beta-galactosidase
LEVKIWFRSKAKYDYSVHFNDWWERDMEAMVAKDYNHPCVVLYSIGNEITETAIPEGVETSRKLADKVRALDSTRYVINCINGMFNVFSSSLQKKGKENKPIGKSVDVLNGYLAPRNPPIVTRRPATRP